MIRLFLLAALLALSNFVFAKGGSNPKATYVQTGDGYEIILTDEHRLMAHDITGLFGGGYTVESHIRTKRVSGVIDASQLEIFELETIDKQTRQRQLKNVLGIIRIQENVLKVELQASMSEDPSKEHRVYEFNGTYKFVRKSSR